MTGQKLGNYEILDKLGEGGMGEVWRARDGRLNRTVAVKVLPHDLAGDPMRRQRFEQEARALGTVNHPNIVAVYDIGQSDGQAYIVSELVDGESLRKLIERGPAPLRKLLEIAGQIADAIAAAHALGIVHRDLKPENIMLTRDGRVKVLDFGLAKQVIAQATSAETATIALSSPGMVLGTVGYMSPEQVRGEVVDGRSDIFSFGCVLYELATGRAAFEGKSAVDIMSAILREEPREMSSGTAAVPPALDSIVRRCLEKDPARRFQSAADLAFALRSVGGSSISSPAQTAVAVANRRRWVLPVAGLALAAVLLTAGYIAANRAGSAAPPQYHRVTFREGSVSSGFFTPDGHNVVYAANWDAGPSRIYLATPGSPESRDLQLPDATLLAISSKGDLAFLVGPFRPDGSGTLARNSVAGGQTRELLEDVLLADWSPDGADLAVVRKVNDKARLEYPIGTVLWESGFAPFSMRISPDGQTVAFTSYAEGSTVALRTVDRARHVQMLGRISGQTTSVDASPLYWTRNGREIWFRSFNTSERNTFYAMDLKGKRRVLARFPGDVQFFDVTADGRVLLSTESGRMGIRGVAPGEATERDLSCLEFAVLKGISDDGSVILADAVGESGGPKGSIYLRHTDGSPPIRLGDGAAFALSPDGKSITGYSSRDTATRRFILMPTGPGETEEIKIKGKPGIIVGWLPGDRNFLIGGWDGQGRWQFSTWNAGNDTVRVISPPGVPDQYPLVSPDGRSVLMAGPEPGWFVYPIDGGERRAVKGITPHDRPFGWRADGKSIYISTHHDQNRTIPVSVLDLETGKRTQWKEIQPTIPVDQATNLHITPDGRAYAYNYGYVRSAIFVAEGLR